MEAEHVRKNGLALGEGAILISYPDLPRPSLKQSEIWVRD